MPNFLLDLNLQQLPDECFAGSWRVASRVLNSIDPSSPLAQAGMLRLGPGGLETQAAGSGTGHAGQWAVQRDTVMNRPYLSFDLPAKNTRALVTRLRRSANGQHSQLHLYFASGMEMQLDCA